MPLPKKARRKHRRREFFTLPVKILAAGALAAIVLAIGGFSFAASQESQDSFCSSCHTQPESTFYQRSTASQPVDLASFHTTKNTRCIDCHSGTGVFGRLGAELLGARNAFAWYTHTAVQPAPQTVPITDDNCIKCHQQVMTGTDFNNHFHAFLPRWQAVDPNAASCVKCHEGHTVDVVANEAYLNEARTTAVCQSCHAVLGGGD